jgi:Mn2+/Fe2+ NRAMP family transporter
MIFSYLLAIIVLLTAIGALMVCGLTIAMVYDEIREHAHKRRANGTR